jgi:hypothetical protein
MIKTIAFLLTATVAHARIGETADQCAARYGTLAEGSLSAPAGRVTFFKDDIQTTCYFHEAKCVSLHFLLQGPDRTKGIAQIDGPAFTEAQRSTILAANGSEWQPAAGTEFTKRFATKDGTRVATHNSATIIIQLVGDIERRKQATSEAAISEAIKGF